MTSAYIARGDAPPIASAKAASASPFKDVSFDAWRSLVQVLAVQGQRDVTSDGIGLFAMRPRRLGDLGVMTNLRRVPDATGRQVWEGDFVLPLTLDKFLGSRSVQESVLVRSVKLHVGEIGSLPSGVTKSGALAILHCAGPGALRAWVEGPRFERTVRIFNQSNGIF